MMECSEIPASEAVGGGADWSFGPGVRLDGDALVARVFELVDLAWPSKKATGIGTSWRRSSTVLPMWGRRRCAISGFSKSMPLPDVERRVLSS
ncbi:MAG: hypothetical protein ACNA8P_06620 [Phycisphaerales bacterium]